MTCTACATTRSGPIVMTVGDTAPALVGHFENGDATASLPATRPDLTGATVKIRIRNSAGTVIKFSSVGLTITNPVTASFSYAWSAPDTAAAGTLRITFVVTFPSGAQETFPSGGRYIRVVVGA